MLAAVVLTLYLAVLGSALPTDQELERRQRASVITRCTVPNTAALTFDDGPFNYIYDINKVLKANNAVGTFFFNGRNYGCIYSADNAKRVKFAYDQGHQVASHTWAHKDLTTLSRDQLTSEFARTDEAIKRITGATPAFMRPPYGKYNNAVLDVAGARKQSVVIWDFDSGDSSGISVAAQKTRYTQLASRRPSTVLTLNHETYASTAYDVLPHAIKQLRAKGYKFVTVAQCLGRAPYQNVGAPAARTAAWTC
ncbi:carbohydrate esterase family 4 protein [Hebeloma cylindrosporum]|uniref:Carbohydrate esterase family 4 protein n=1 Tax=Hebeloma cylindrosporum TaxID=76867 RepID=A0A0C3CK94_HEBCY|nr:carbohydrate esterase family 4 protein [Hebeloma cylindrosporum h7]